MSLKWTGLLLCLALLLPGCASAARTATRIAVVEGTVTNTRGENLAGVTVTTDGMQTRTNASGRFSFAYTREGTHTYRFTKEGYGPAEITETASPEPGVDKSTVKVAVKLSPDHGGAGGRVTDEVTGRAIPGVKVAGGSASTTTDASGRYQLTLPLGTHTLKFTLPDEYGEKTRSVTVDGYGFANGDIALHPLKGTLKGKVLNAVTGGGLSGVGVRAGSASATTAADGSYSMRLAEGSYTVSFTKTGFIARTAQQIAIRGGKDTAHNETMSEQLSSNQYRVVLDWNTGFVLDLDSHLLGIMEGGGKYHISYLNKTEPSAKAKLDLDDRTGDKMETTTFTPLMTGTFKFYVKDFTNQNVPDSSVLSASGATVTVYRGDALVRTFRVPTGHRGIYWDVFHVENGQFVPVDRFVSTEPYL